MPTANNNRATAQPCRRWQCAQGQWGTSTANNWRAAQPTAVATPDRYRVMMLAAAAPCVAAPPASSGELRCYLSRRAIELPRLQPCNRALPPAPCATTHSLARAPPQRAEQPGLLESSAGVAAWHASPRSLAQQPAALPTAPPPCRRSVAAHSRLSSLARCVAEKTAFMKAARTPAFSSSCTPAIVVPPGEVTMSCNRRKCKDCSIMHFRTQYKEGVWSLTDPRW